MIPCLCFGTIWFYLKDELLENKLSCTGTLILSSCTQNNHFYSHNETFYIFCVSSWCGFWTSPSTDWTSSLQHSLLSLSKHPLSKRPLSNLSISIWSISAAISLFKLPAVQQLQWISTTFLLSR